MPGCPAGRAWRLVATAALLGLGSAACTPVSTTKTGSPKPRVVTAESLPVFSNPYVSKPKVRTAQTRLVRPGGGYQKLGKPYRIGGRLYVPQREPGYNATGVASWYGKQFHGRLTANGERFDMNGIMAAHPTMPLPSYARVTNLENGKSIVVRVNDRGPYAHDRLIDLSRRAAAILDFKQKGTAKVRVQYLGDAPLHGRDERYIVSSYQGSGPVPKARQDGTGPILASYAEPPIPRPGVAFPAGRPGDRLDRATVDNGTPFDPFLSIGRAGKVAGRGAGTATASTSYAATSRVSGAFDAIENLIR